MNADYRHVHQEAASRTTSCLRLSRSNPLGLKPCQSGLGAWGENSSLAGKLGENTEIAAAGILPQAHGKQEICSSLYSRRCRDKEPEGIQPLA